MTKKTTILLFLLTCVGWGPGCAHDLVTGKSSYNWFKVDDDVSLGKQVLGAQLTSFEQKNIPVNASKDQEMVERLRVIVKNVGKASHGPELPYEVHLADSEVVNAWCAPGGKIMVYSGLWDEKKGLVNKSSDDEIAAVLSHEISHATARHVTESLSQNMTIMLAGTVASSAIGAGVGSQASNLFGQFFSTGYNIYAPMYSQKNENEADVLGLFYMAKAGYNPQAALEVWTRAAKKKGAPYSIFASHPSSGERAKRLSSYLPQAMAIYQNPELPYPDFKTLLKAPKKGSKQQAHQSAPTPESQPAPKSDL